jgi:hypothetical protein
VFCDIFQEVRVSGWTLATECTEGSGKETIPNKANGKSIS